MIMRTQISFQLNNTLVILLDDNNFNVDTRIMTSETYRTKIRVIRSALFQA